MHCWPNVEGMSQLWECPKQSSLILSEQTCCSCTIWKQMRAKFIPAVSDVNNLKGKIISKFYSLLQKYRGSHSSEYLSPLWGFLPFRIRWAGQKAEAGSAFCELTQCEKSSVMFCALRDVFPSVFPSRSC